jgi:hypothetical protein
MRFLISFALLFLGCSTHLASVDVQAEQASRTLSAAGYADHEDDEAGLDKLRYQAIYCNSGGILNRSGNPPVAVDGGPQCPGAQ